MTKQNPKVDWYFAKSRWKAELEAARAILLGCGLTEELKWGKPCYTQEGSNVVILQGFKEFCALLFPRGVLLQDPAGILEKPGANTQGARRIRMTGVPANEAVLRAYIKEAIDVQKAGLEVAYKTTAEFAVPDELRHKFHALPALQSAFEALTPGRQRGYLLHFTAAKQAKTREARIDQCAARIFAGKGLRDPEP